MINELKQIVGYLIGRFMLILCQRCTECTTDCLWLKFPLQGRSFKIKKQTSSPKGNDRSPDNKSSKYFEQFSSKRFINWARAANSAVHGWIRPNFKLFRDYLVVLGTYKNEEDPTYLQNEGARVLTSLYIDFSDAQG